MATIKARKQANGEMRYTAIVRVRSGQTVLHSESKTFGYRSAASTRVTCGLQYVGIGENARLLTCNQAT
jgi:hypothetical protein